MTCTPHSQQKAETTEMIFNTYFISIKHPTPPPPPHSNHHHHEKNQNHFKIRHLQNVYIYFCRQQISRQNDDAGNSLHILSYCGLLRDNDRCLFVKHTGGKEIIILPNIYQNSSLAWGAPIFT